LAQAPVQASYAHVIKVLEFGSNLYCENNEGGLSRILQSTSESQRSVQKIDIFIALKLEN
jgi:hypothetical protein